MHFKTLVEAYEKCSDPKTREGMKEVLVKCKVFRMKGREMVKEVDVDRLSLMVDCQQGGAGGHGGHHLANPHSGKSVVAPK